MARPLVSKFALVCVGLLALAAPSAAQTGQAVSLCDAVTKFVTGKAGRPFAGDHATSIGTNGWKARTQITQGDCAIAAMQGLQMYSCAFANGANAADLSSSYQSMVGGVQACLTGLHSRYDWRKRQGNGAGQDGAMMTQTTWIWTRLRSQDEYQVQANSAAGGSAPNNNHLIVLWRSINSQ
jgi:hypothetical protein